MPHACHDMRYEDMIAGGDSDGDRRAVIAYQPLVKLAELRYRASRVERSLMISVHEPLT